MFLVELCAVFLEESTRGYVVATRFCDEKLPWHRSDTSEQFAIELSSGSAPSAFLSAVSVPLMGDDPSIDCFLFVVGSLISGEIDTWELDRMGWSVTTDDDAW